MKVVKDIKPENALLVEIKTKINTINSLLNKLSRQEYNSLLKNIPLGKEELHYKFSKNDSSTWFDFFKITRTFPFFSRKIKIRYSVPHSTYSQKNGLEFFVPSDNNFTSFETKSNNIHSLTTVGLRDLIRNLDYYKDGLLRSNPTLTR